MSALLLSLFIVNLGIALGAGLYESRIVVPQWLIRSADGRTHWNAAAAVAANVGLRFWVYVTTGPLTLLTFANLFAALQAVGPARNWWLTAVIAAALDRASTFGYFIPTMLRLTRPDGPTGDEAARLATKWAQLDYIRHGLTLAALVAALCALTLLTETGR
jgi:hypothetical protein